MTCAVQEVRLGDSNGTFWSYWCLLGVFRDLIITTTHTLCLTSVFYSVSCYREDCSHYYSSQNDLKAKLNAFQSCMLVGGTDFMGCKVGGWRKENIVVEDPT